MQIALPLLRRNPVTSVYMQTTALAQMSQCCKAQQQTSAFLNQLIVFPKAGLLCVAMAVLTLSLTP